MKVTVNDNQTLLDIAVQYYGTPEAIGQILLDNPEIINDPVAPVPEDCRPGNFYPHIRLTSGQQLEMEDNHKLIRKNIVKKINKDVSTYITESWQEQLNK